MPEQLTPPPPIGQYWPEQGGIYAGITRGEDGKPDAHLIVAADTIDLVTWERAVELSSAYSADGHTDFHAPTRTESALCYANLKPEFSAVYDGWYWTGAQLGTHGAWAQYFRYGSQYWDRKSAEFRVRPVRTIQLNP